MSVWYKADVCAFRSVTPSDHVRLIAGIKTALAVVIAVYIPSIVGAQSVQVRIVGALVAICGKLVGFELMAFSAATACVDTSDEAQRH